MKMSGDFKYQVFFFFKCNRTKQLLLILISFSHSDHGKHNLEHNNNDIKRTENQNVKTVILNI